MLLVIVGFAPLRISLAEPHLELPDIGDRSGKVISPTQEKMLGENLMRWLRKNRLILDDPLIQDYIDSVGYRLLPASDAQGHKFTFFVVNDNTINAFAAPGGFIGVNTGLILTTQSESELAAVLAHEIAHITQRHMARAFDAASQQQLASTVAILAAILLGQQNSELAEAALSAGIASSAQMQINFTRANEYEADRIGIQALSDSGYDPFSMATFFGRMEKASRLQGPKLPEFLSTHPVSVSRIADAQNRANQLDHPKVDESLNYHLVHARIRALSSNDSRVAENQFRQNLENGQYRNQDAEQYGYILALMENQKYTDAKKQLIPLLQKDPSRIAYKITQARLEMKLEKTEQALTIYKNALLDSPFNHALSIHYAEDLLTANQAKQAHSFLQDYLRNQPPDARLYKLLAQASTAAGYQAEAHEHMAEYYYLIGETRAAIEQLSLASSIKDLGFYQSSRIEARMQQLKAIEKIEAAR